MEADALINLALSYSDNIDPLDSDNENRRARALLYLQETVDFIWFFRPWSWTYTSGSVTVLSGNSSVDLPADFNQITKNGQVTRSSDSIELVEIPEHMLLTIRTESILSGRSTVDEYALFGFNSTTSRRLIQTIQVQANTTLGLYYKKVPPTLIDADTASGLTQVPAEYHHSAVLPGVVAKLRVSKGDSRDFRAQFMEGLAHMTAAERPIQRLVQHRAKAMKGQW